MSKSSIKKTNPDFDIELFGTLDFAMFLCYSVAQFLSGSVGDNFNKKWVLVISYLIQAAMFALLAVAGVYQIKSHPYFLSCFILLGLSQSIVFPTLVSIVSTWFSKDHRGIITGSWGTSTNIGNIIGAQVAALVLRGREAEEWYLLMQTIAIIFFVIALLSGTVLSPYPERHQLIIDKKDAINKVTQAQQPLQINEEANLIEHADEPKGITPWEAIKIPGVVLYGFSFFCVKFSVYAILLWLPLFLEDALGYEKSQIANL